MQKMRRRVNNWLRTCVGVSAGLLILAVGTMGQATTDPQKGQAAEQPTQGQQLCAPGAGTCKVILDSPATKAPSRTSGQAASNCPDTKQPVKTKPKPKSE